MGPIVQGKVTERDRQLLASCYRSCLEMADAAGLRSIAFCCISTGAFGYPPEAAAPVAVGAVRKYLKNHLASALEKIVFDVYQDRDKILYGRALD